MFGTKEMTKIKNFLSDIRSSIVFIARVFISRLRHPGVDAGIATVLSKDSVFEGSNKVGEFSIISKSVIGRYTYCGSRVNIAATDIGAFCSIASDVKIGLHEHPTYGYVSTYPAFHTKWGQTPWVEINKIWNTQKSTIIGNDVWIGESAIIKAGVTIGDGAVIGAGAVVTKDVPPYAIMAGVPARILRLRATENQIKALESIAWWNWNESKIAKHVDTFWDIERFVKKWS